MKILELGDVCKAVSSNIAQKNLQNNEGIYPIYGASGWIKNVDFFKQEKEYIAIVKDGAGIGRTMILPAYSSVIGTMQYIIPNEEIKIDLKYLYYAILHMNLGKYYSGATIPHIYFKDYRRESVIVYELEKQRTITSVLCNIDKLLELKNIQLEKLDQLVKSRFIEMFGDINTNSKGWKKIPLGELCSISRGGSPRPIDRYLGGNVPWIKIGDATDGDNIFLTKTKEHITQDGVKKSHLVKSGSLIFANCGVSLGFARIITFEGCIHDGWLSFEDVDEKLDKVFLLLTLNFMTKHFRLIAPAGTQPNLNTTIMKKHMQIVPPLSLQKEYVAFVQQVDKSKLAVQKSLDELETLKKALMQEYFG